MTGTGLAGTAVFCQFIGWSRSGTTLVGSLLNAHPEVLIAQEADVSALVAAGEDRDGVLRALHARDAEFAGLGRRWNGYDYAVASPVTGPAGPLRVIGDKKAGGTVEVEAVEPGTLARTQALLGLPLRLLCVTRNPYDTVATLSRHLDTDVPAWFRCQPDPLAAAVEWYLLLATLVQRIVDSAVAPVHVLRLERLIHDTTAELSDVLQFLGVRTIPDDYLAACRDLVRPQPSRASTVAWDDRSLDRLDRGIAALPLLAAYREAPC